MAEIKEIEEWSEHIEKSRNSKRLEQQRLDQEYFEDTFEIKHVYDKDYITRNAFVSELENSVAPQVISDIPKVYTDAKNDKVIASSDRVASLLNKWVYVLCNQPTNPFVQTFKWMAFQRGESWIYTPHNDELLVWDGDWRDVYPPILPVKFILYDPMVVFHEPSEDDKTTGDPTRVLVKFQRSVGDIKNNYPYWNNRKNYKDTDKLDYKLYFDVDTRYASFDDDPLFRDDDGNLTNGDGRLENIYGFVPFSHQYSGYGTETSDLEPSLLAFTRTRMIRDRVKEKTAMATDFRKNIHETAWPIIEVVWPIGEEIPADLLAEYSNKPGTIAIFKGPPGSKPEVRKTATFDAPVFAYNDRVTAELNSAHPLPVKGIASGTSGRQEDVLSNSALAMYDFPLKAVSKLWASAFDKALEICSMPILGLLPKGLKENDYKSYSSLKVDVEKKNPQDLSRKAAEGDQRYKMGLIDFIEHAIVYQNKTKEEAERLYARVMIDMAMRNDPAFMMMITQTVAEEIGAEERLNQIRQVAQGGALNKIPQTGSKGGQERLGNIRSPYGAESNTRHETRLPAGM